MKTTKLSVLLAVMVLVLSGYALRGYVVGQQKEIDRYKLLSERYEKASDLLLGELGRRMDQVFALARENSDLEIKLLAEKKKNEPKLVASCPKLKGDKTANTISFGDDGSIVSDCSYQSVPRVRKEYRVINGKIVAVAIIPSIHYGKYVALSHAKGDKYCYSVARDEAMKKMVIKYQTCDELSEISYRYDGKGSEVMLGFDYPIFVNSRDLHEATSFILMEKSGFRKTVRGLLRSFRKIDPYFQAYIISEGIRIPDEVKAKKWLNDGPVDTNPNLPPSPSFTGPRDAEYGPGSEDRSLNGSF